MGGLRANPCLQAIDGVMQEYGVPYNVERGGKHPRVVFEINGARRRVGFSDSPSDRRRGPLKAAAEVRRAIQEMMPERFQIAPPTITQLPRPDFLEAPQEVIIETAAEAPALPDETIIAPAEPAPTPANDDLLIGQQAIAAVASQVLDSLKPLLDAFAHHNVRLMRSLDTKVAEIKGQLDGILAQPQKPDTVVDYISIIEIYDMLGLNRAPRKMSLSKKISNSLLLFTEAKGVPSLIYSHGKFYRRTFRKDVFDEWYAALGQQIIASHLAN